MREGVREGKKIALKEDRESGRDTGGKGNEE